MSRNRELDAEIAEKIYGWQLIKVAKDANGENEGETLAENGVLPEGVTFPPVGKIGRGFLTPNYSGNWELALNLAKRVKLDISVIDIPNTPEDLCKMCLERWEQKL